MGKVLAVCTSEKKGLQKHDVHSAHFETEWGIDGDAHAGKWHRQISLLSADKIEAFNQKGANVIPGAFGENLVVDGFDFRALPVGTLLRCGDVLLEMTQIGKECHSHCEIYKKMGDCIMPREGVFARVLEPGTITVGDEMVIVPREGHFPWQAAVISLSANSDSKCDNDLGTAISNRLTKSGYTVLEDLVVPKDARVLKQQIIRLCDQRQLDLILTTGGISCSKDDFTPEATLAVADKNVPGISEAIRSAAVQVCDKAMISHSASVIRGKTLIINLPDNLQACMDTMDVFMDTIPQAMAQLRGEELEK